MMNKGILVFKGFVGSDIFTDNTHFKFCQILISPFEHAQQIICPTLTKI